jgi:S-adenosylmethionine-diacylgycerolhomoserine-N-methlytransferase
MSPVGQVASLERYYRFHARIYDATRWSFLFGRAALVRRVAALRTPTRILEIGCGTGRNLLDLSRCFPNARLTGVDLSGDMLAKARQRLGTGAGQVEWLRQAYEQPLRPAQPFDLVLCSYTLSMINPGWERVIEATRQDLQPGGLIAVVDFHESGLDGFKRWMGLNHVRMEGHLLPALNAGFRPVLSETRAAYGGVWRYLTFIGER